MKILYISHFIPFPPTGGASLRNFNLIKQLAEEHSVHLVTFTQSNRHGTPEKILECTEAVRMIVDEIQVFEVPSDASKWRWYCLLLCNLFSTEPYSVWRFRSSRFDRALKEQLERNDFDVVHIDTIPLAHHYRLLGATPVVMNHHNIESSLLFRRARSLKNPLARGYMSLQGWKLRRFERMMAGRVQGNVTVSELDKEELKKVCPEARVGVVSNGTDPEFFQPASGPAKEPRLVFAGSMQWYPNAEAMIWFARDIWPRIKEKVPAVSMDLIGSHPPPEVLKVAEEDSSFRVRGFVDDVRPFIDEALVYVVPIRVGGGTRLKILDAMAMGKAIVSHSIGAEGIELEDGEDILIADEAQDFADLVVGLIGDRSRCSALGKSARETVLERYTWDRIVGSLTGIYETVANTSPPGVG